MPPSGRPSAPGRWSRAVPTAASGNRPTAATAWTDITRNPGLPTGENIRQDRHLGLAGQPGQGLRPDAEEADENGLYRSDDGGANWEFVNDDPALHTRNWYYTHIYADPGDENTVWVLEQQFLKSIDAGQSFTSMPVPHGDNHDIWVDPKNPQRIIEGNDEGAIVSFNGAASWSSIMNQPTAQFYHVTVDNRVPSTSTARNRTTRPCASRASASTARSRQTTPFPAAASRVISR
ncbi:MAG: hypothetical protein R2849_14915 [Thermomicrobiales bacterium]